MKIHLVLECWDREGAMVISAHTSQKQAEQVVAFLSEKDPNDLYHWYEVEEVTLL